MQKKELKIAVVNITEQEFYIFEQEYIKSKKKEISFSLIPSMNFILDKESVSITILAEFTHKESGKLLVKGKTRTDFKVIELKDFLDENERLFKLPDKIMAILIGLSVTHTRAILAMHTKGTSYNDLVLPIIDPVQFLKDLNDLNKQSKVAASE